MRFVRVTHVKVRQLYDVGKPYAVLRSDTPCTRALPVDDRVARESGRLKAAVADRGGRPRRRNADLAIAATARTPRISDRGRYAARRPTITANAYCLKRQSTSSKPASRSHAS